MEATWNGVTLAESEATTDAVREGCLKPSGSHTRCPRTGYANHETRHDPALKPRGCAPAITDRVAFGRAVKAEG